MKQLSVALVATLVAVSVSGFVGVAKANSSPVVTKSYLNLAQAGPACAGPFGFFGQLGIGGRPPSPGLSDLLFRLTIVPAQKNASPRGTIERGVIARRCGLACGACLLFAMVMFHSRHAISFAGRLIIVGFGAGSPPMLTRLILRGFQNAGHSLSSRTPRRWQHARGKRRWPRTS